MESNSELSIIEIDSSSLYKDQSCQTDVVIFESEPPEYCSLPVKDFNVMKQAFYLLEHALNNNGIKGTPVTISVTNSICDQIARLIQHHVI